MRLLLDESMVFQCSLDSLEGFHGHQRFPLPLSPFSIRIQVAAIDRVSQDVPKTANVQDSAVALREAFLAKFIKHSFYGIMASRCKAKRFANDYDKVRKGFQ
jgi:hypothetical protein